MQLKDLLQKNPQQAEAVTTVDGPVLVFVAMLPPWRVFSRTPSDDEVTLT